jgi:hydrogenase small subunit
MPFMDAPPGGTLTSALNKPYGVFTRSIRAITNANLNKEPKWRHNRDRLTTGFDPRWRAGQTAAK